MEPDCKRPKVEELKTPGNVCEYDSDDKVLKTFIEWCRSQGLKFSAKVKIGKGGSCSHYGMVAVDHIHSGELLFSIPRPALLSPYTSDIQKSIDSDSLLINCSNQWIPLLLTLMYESSKGADSKFAPYLNIVPHATQIDLPMFWGEEELDMLVPGTGITEAVKDDMERMNEDYDKVIKPFIEKHSPEIFKFTDDVDMYGLYKQMVAFVMAYSFSSHIDDDCEDIDDDDDNMGSAPVMAPVADILNHVSHNNAKLQYHELSLDMVAVTDIKKGSEVYNTYGMLSNADLLRMYGFAEEPPLCTNDEVVLPVSLVRTASYQVSSSSASTQCPDKQTMEERWRKLAELEVVGEDTEFVYTSTGFTDNHDILQQLLTVLGSSEEAFREYCHNDGWTETENQDESEDDELTNASIEKLGEFSRLVLQECCTVCISKLPAAAASNSLQKQQQNSTAHNPGSSRQLYSGYVCEGQRALYQTLLQHCSCGVK